MAKDKKDKKKKRDEELMSGTKQFINPGEPIVMDVNPIEKPATMNAKEDIAAQYAFREAFKSNPMFANTFYLYRDAQSNTYHLIFLNKLPDELGQDVLSKPVSVIVPANIVESLKSAIDAVAPKK